MGPASVNQAVKAVIIARRLLLARDQAEAAVSAELLPDVGPDAVLLRVARTAPLGAPLPPAPDACSLKAAAEGKVVAIAGALAGKLRDGAPHVTITGIGPGAVLTATKALARAAGFLAAEGISIFAFPDFVAASITGGVPGAARARAAGAASQPAAPAATAAAMSPSLARGVAHAQAVAAAALSMFAQAGGGGGAAATAAAAAAPAPPSAWPFTAAAPAPAPAASAAPGPLGEDLLGLAALGPEVDEALGLGAGAGGRMGTAVVLHVFAARTGPGAAAGGGPGR